MKKIVIVILILIFCVLAVLANSQLTTPPKPTLVSTQSPTPVTPLTTSESSTPAPSCSYKFEDLNLYLDEEVPVDLQQAFVNQMCRLEQTALLAKNGQASAQELAQAQTDFLDAYFQITPYTSQYSFYKATSPEILEDWLRIIHQANTPSTQIVFDYAQDICEDYFEGDCLDFTHYQYFSAPGYSLELYSYEYLPEWTGVVQQYEKADVHRTCQKQITPDNVTEIFSCDITWVTLYYSCTGVINIGETGLILADYQGPNRCEASSQRTVR